MYKTLFLLLLLSVSTQVLQGETIKGLGTATFPTSTRSAAAQEDFIRGLLLLHLFEYGDAAKSYWGEAMTFNHGVWN
jgi:hypothetical protein